MSGQQRLDPNGSCQHPPSDASGEAPSQPPGTVTQPEAPLHSPWLSKLVTAKPLTTAQLQQLLMPARLPAGPSRPAVHIKLPKPLSSMLRAMSQRQPPPAQSAQASGGAAPAAAAAAAAPDAACMGHMDQSHGEASWLQHSTQEEEDLAAVLASLRHAPILQDSLAAAPQLQCPTAAMQAGPQPPHATRAAAMQPQQLQQAPSPLCEQQLQLPPQQCQNEAAGSGWHAVGDGNHHGVAERGRYGHAGAEGLLLRAYQRKRSKSLEAAPCRSPPRKRPRSSSLAQQGRQQQQERLDSGQQRKVWSRPAKGYTRKREVADLTNKVVEVPGYIFDVDAPCLYFRARVLGPDKQHASAVVLRTLDDGKRWYFPAGQVREWAREMEVRSCAGHVLTASPPTASDHSDAFHSDKFAAQPTNSMASHGTTSGAHVAVQHGRLSVECEQPVTW